jgi:hypothetical protein
VGYKCPSKAPQTANRKPVDRSAPIKARKPPSQRKLKERSPLARSRVSNGRDVLPGVDGRTEIARRFYDICQALIADQAGLDRCSEARLQLIRRFAAAAVMAEAMEAKLASGEPIDIGQHAQLCSSLVRLTSRIGINRKAREIVPSLAEYITVEDEDAA